jgi:hypothetical protein
MAFDLFPRHKRLPPTFCGWGKMPIRTQFSMVLSAAQMYFESVAKS